jgi:hypothetical protein
MIYGGRTKESGGQKENEICTLLMKVRRAAFSYAYKHIHVLKR